jgi:hypothetical protein
MKPLVHLNYPLDVEILLLKADLYKRQGEAYYDPRYKKTLDYWLQYKINNDSYINRIMDDFGLNGKPRFYWLQANSVLPEHVDNNTTCSLNFILSEDPAPVTIGGDDYLYSQCLLNTTIPHSVTNTGPERILLKISLFDVSYQDVVSLIPDQYKENNE